MGAEIEPSVVCEISVVTTPCHAAQHKHSLEIQPARDGELDEEGVEGREEKRWAGGERRRPGGRCDVRVVLSVSLI